MRCSDTDDIIVMGDIEARFSGIADLIYLTKAISFIVPSIDRKITLAIDFASDGASIHRLLWRVVGHPFLHSFLLAALLHDGLYQSELLPRKLADWVFLVFLVQLAKAENARCLREAKGWRKIPARIKAAWRRVRPWAMWAAVRIGGRFVWMEHTAESVQEARQLVTIS